MTKIEWCARPGTIPESWNPVTGCAKVSPGCQNCYAEHMARRLAGRHGYPEAPNHFSVTLHPDRLDVPLRWRKLRTAFVCSMGDLFHIDVRVNYMASVLSRIATTPQHTYLCLTKRAVRMNELFNSPEFAELLLLKTWKTFATETTWPISNLWLGVSVEDQERADERIPLLLQTPAVVRFVSVEPCLSAVNLSEYLMCQQYAGKLKESRPGTIGGKPYRAARIRPRLDWVICGGESGSGARPMHPDWARSIRDQCQAAGTPFFFKQWGAWTPDTRMVATRWSGIGQPPDGIKMIGDSEHGYQWMARVGKKRAGRLLDGEEWNQWPKV